MIVLWLEGYSCFMFAGEFGLGEYWLCLVEGAAGKCVWYM